MMLVNKCRVCEERYYQEGYFNYTMCPTCRRKNIEEECRQFMEDLRLQMIGLAALSEWKTGGTK